jgi:phosphate transport system substrate-binding protein
LLLFGIAGTAYYLLRPHGGSSSSLSSIIPSLSSIQTPLLRLSGSNTIGAQLGPDLVQAWLASKGATGIARETTKPDEMRILATLDGKPVSIEVKAHGSATAFTDLAAGEADIGMASRAIKAAETRT